MARENDADLTRAIQRLQHRAQVAESHLAEARQLLADGRDDLVHRCLRSGTVCAGCGFTWPCWDEEVRAFLERPNE